MNVQQQAVRIISWQPRDANGNAVTLQQPINLNFKPDEIVVKQISYTTEVTDNIFIGIVTSNLVADQDLFSIAGLIANNSYVQAMDIRFFDPNFRMSQLATFPLVDALTRIPTIGARGVLSFTLHFIKYGENVDIPNK